MRYAVGYAIATAIMVFALLFIVFELSDLRAENQLLMQAIQDARVARCQ